MNLDDFEQELECTYKNEQYSVRDNGAVLRHAPKVNRSRPTDNKWTFGKLNGKKEYLEIASVPIHRIVATAFYGGPRSREQVVDHIDTNKQNNRPENLRWVTRLENILLNPITAKRIAMVCGSVEAFLADPAKHRDKFQEPNLKWMQTVTKEEAQISTKRLLEWADSDKKSSGLTLDDWIFTSGGSKTIPDKSTVLVKSENKNAVQKDWTTPSEFPCCPSAVSDTPIYSYANNLKNGEIFSSNRYSKWIIVDHAISNDNNKLWVMCSSSEPNPIKPWSLAQVTYEANFYVHTNLGSFFKRNGAEKRFTLEQGLEWTGGETYDDLT